jgi:hypothetical protein
MKSFVEFITEEIADAVGSALSKYKPRKLSGVNHKVGVSTKKTPSGKSITPVTFSHKGNNSYYKSHVTSALLKHGLMTHGKTEDHDSGFTIHVSKM